MLSSTFENRLSDFKVNIFRSPHVSVENSRTNLMANIIFFGLKLFVSRSGGSL